MSGSARRFPASASLAAVLLLTSLADRGLASPHDVLPAVSMLHPHVSTLEVTRVMVAQPSPIVVPERRPAALVPLYVSFAALQVLDTESTRAAMRRGYAESNPLLRPVAGNGAAMMAVKIGATAATVVAIERLWRRNRTAAVITMIGVNVGYSIVVANNYRKLARE